MGMYTEFETNLLLKKDTPIDIINMIKCLVGGKENYTGNLTKVYKGNLTEKDHAFLGNERYDCVLDCNNCSCTNYEKPTFTQTEDGYVLTSNPEFKNWNNVIDLFLDWIRPYVVKGFLEDGAVGRKKYEEFYTSTYFHLDVIGYNEVTEPEDDYGYYR